MIVLIVLFAGLYGYLAHQTRGFVYRRFGGGWRELVSYSVGVLLVFPIFALLAWIMNQQNEEDTKRVSLAYFLAYVPFGVGTFLGWLADGGNGSQI